MYLPFNRKGKRIEERKKVLNSHIYCCIAHSRSLSLHLKRNKHVTKLFKKNLKK